MTRLIVVRGLPASGKSTRAREWVAADRKHRVRVNRDDLRAMIDDGAFVAGVTEDRITDAEFALIQAFLNDGFDVICDDTNLPERTMDWLRDCAHDYGARLEVIDMRDVPLETCIERNSKRDRKRKVPEERIRDMHARYIEKKKEEER